MSNRRQRAVSNYSYYLYQLAITLYFATIVKLIGKICMRPSKRAFDELRTIKFEPNVNKHAEGSCLINFGDTQVLCTASIERRLPVWLRDSGKGWITAEYGMLPRATSTRTRRESTQGRQTGRTIEIQRLIGRSLRAITDLNKMPEIQIKIDCDVIHADGGTRTAAITGSYVALHLALIHLRKEGALTCIPILDQVAAVSCGIYQGRPILDLDYAEDSNAQADANFVLTEKGRIVEIQATAEEVAFSAKDFSTMMALAKKGIKQLADLQKKALTFD